MVYVYGCVQMNQKSAILFLMVWLAATCQSKNAIGAKMGILSLKKRQTERFWDVPTISMIIQDVVG